MDYRMDDQDYMTSTITPAIITISTIASAVKPILFMRWRVCINDDNVCARFNTRWVTLYK